MQALKSAGQNVDLEIITGVDHFDLVERLPDPDYSLAQASTVFLLPLTHPRLQTADVYVFFGAKRGSFRGLSVRLSGKMVRSTSS